MGWIDANVVHPPVRCDTETHRNSEKVANIVWTNRGIVLALGTNAIQ